MQHDAWYRHHSVKVLVAGVGNVLRGDDGFGVAVAERLMSEPAPRGVRVIEVGIGGIHLVQELLDGFDALVVIDALDLGRGIGTVVVMEPDVLDVGSLSASERHDQLADVHYATPERAFMLAAALDRLPRSTWVVGCQVADTERYGEGLSEPVRGAVEPAAEEVRRLVTELGVGWPGPRLATTGTGSDLMMEREREGPTDERRTEHGDELPEEHSLARQEEKPEEPYRRPRQPAQDREEAGE